MTKSIRIGDIVQPKFGGPKMIVIQVSDIPDERDVWCAWTEQSQKHNTRFKPDDLEVVN